MMFVKAGKPNFSATDRPMQGGPGADAETGREVDAMQRRRKGARRRCCATENYERTDISHTNKDCNAACAAPCAVCTRICSCVCSVARPRSRIVRIEWPADDQGPARLSLSHTHLPPE
eukprot:scaffold11806_cov95-Isochrysis_galbana.AAC.2